MYIDTCQTYSFNCVGMQGSRFKKILNLAHRVKGKAVQLQAHTGPEGSRKLRLPDFKTIGT
jgi:hypothetical protein